jgi:phosphoglycerate kinase
VLLLENTRFHAGDTDNDIEFATELAQPFDVFVNDAFGVCHREQGSVSSVARLIQERYIGLLLRAELTFLLKALESPRRSGSIRGCVH